MVFSAPDTLSKITDMSMVRDGEKRGTERVEERKEGKDQNFWMSLFLKAILERKIYMKGYFNI